MKIEIDQIITQIISFLIILWILSRYAWKPLLKLLDERKNKMKSDWDAIDEQRKQVENLTLEYQKKLKQLDAQAHEKMAQVVEEAKVQAQAIQEQAHQQAREILIHAQEDLQKEILQARVTMKKELIEMALNATEKVLQRNVDKDAQTQYVSDLLDKMEVH